MSTPNDAMASGLQPADKEFLDLSTAQVIRKRISPSDRSMTKEAAAAYQRGEIDLAHVQAPEAPPYSAPPPPPPPVPAAQTAITTPAQLPPAPVDERYPPRVNDRINKLYGQKREAEEYSARLEAALNEQRQRVDQLLARESNRSNSGIDTNQQSSPGAGEYVSRQEMQALLDRERQVVGDLFLGNAHNASRVDAERDFPEIFRDESLRQSADRIWQQDRYLQRDPNGPYKAAALARGLSISDARSAAADAATADAKKAALSGVGPSIPVGSGQAVTRDQLYQQAMARAKQTQDPVDFVRARQIQLGQFG